MRFVLFAAVALLSLTACDGGKSRPGSTQGLSRPDAEAQERSLHTTDLAVSAMGVDPLVITVVNSGPNPADDVWLDVTSARPAPAGCQKTPTGFQCHIGELQARARVTREVSDAATIKGARVMDRTGFDSNPDDNVIRF